MSLNLIFFIDIVLLTNEKEKKSATKENSRNQNKFVNNSTEQSFKVYTFLNQNIQLNSRITTISILLEVVSTTKLGNN